MPDTTAAARSPKRTLLARPALERRLDDAFGRRLTLLVAGAGFGKSTLLSAWASDIESVWYAMTTRDRSVSGLAQRLTARIERAVPGLPAELAKEPARPAGDETGWAETFGALLCEALDDHLGHDLVVVLDDLHNLDGAGASAQLVETLCRQAPPMLHVVLATRSAPPFAIARLKGQGEVLEIDAASLAFTADEVAALLRTTVDVAAASYAASLHDATRGWPAAVRLAVEALRTVPADDREAALERLRRPKGTLFSYLAEEVFAREPCAT